MAKNKDFETSTGKGGETHQHVPKKGPHSKPDAHLTIDYRNRHPDYIKATSKPSRSLSELGVRRRNVLSRDKVTDSDLTAIYLKADDLHAARSANAVMKKGGGL